ncbi:MAG: aromatic ring-hydroxylating dioxygenase subunit alpha [Spirulina sp. SIO3F2]|nr:aromatic ring-hydroxylating dioxygenase subunit alpha [Spirulina sp. SIO3F2]
MFILPKEAYTSQDWFDREQALIFSRTWRFAGFVEDLCDPGDYITVQAGLNNILVLLDEQKQLRAFHNVCRHRGTQLLRAAGKKKQFLTCPYHDWTYNLEGQLTGVPDRKTQFPGLDLSTFCLHKAAVSVWKGMLFVHPDPEAQPLSQWFEPIEPYLGPHQPEKLVEYVEGRERHEINANWKIIVENYIDGYHLAHLHSATLFMYDHRKQQSGFVGNHFYFYEPLSQDYLADIKKNAPLPLIDHIPQNKLGAYTPMLFPSLGLGADECNWSTFLVIPVAPDRSIVEIRARAMPMSDWQYVQQQWSSWNHFKNYKWRKYKTEDSDDPLASGDFTQEDIYVCEQQQKSLKSPYFSVGAMAQELEQAIYQYQRNIWDYLQNGELHG